MKKDQQPPSVQEVKDDAGHECLERNDEGGNLDLVILDPEHAAQQAMEHGETTADE